MRISRPRRAWVGLLLLTCLVTGTAFSWEWANRLTLSHFREDNITNEINGRWMENGTAREFDLFLGAGREVGTGKRWNLGLDLTFTDFASFDMYDHQQATLRVAYRQKEGLGPRALWWRAGLDLGTRRFPNHDLHDADIFDLSLDLGKQISPRVSLSGGVRFDHLRGRTTEIFDNRGISLNLRGQYQISSRWLFTFGGQSRRGDVIVHGYDGYYPEFGHVVVPGWAPWWGKSKVIYKIPGAQTYAWNCGFTWGLSPVTSINLIFERRETHKKGWMYRDDLSKVIFVYEF